MTITAKQARQRFTTLPERLQDALFSEQTSQIMDGIAKQYHLDATRLDAVNKIVSYVLLGFFHPEDVAQEMHSQPGWPPELAKDISQSLDAKIFSVLREDLARSYAPAAPSVEEKHDANGPQIIQQVDSTLNTISPTAKPNEVSKGATTPAPAPQIISQTFTATPRTGSFPPIPAPAPNLKDTGWSKQNTSTNPAPVKMPIPSPVKDSKFMSEFDRLDLTKKVGPAASSASIPPAPPRPQPKQEAPVMLNQVTPITQVSRIGDIKSDLGKRNQMTQATAIPQPSRPAILEIGSVPKPPAPKPLSSTPAVPIPKPPVKDGVPKLNVINYKEPRTITEVTAPPPKPPKTI